MKGSHARAWNRWAKCARAPLPCDSPHGPKLNVFPDGHTIINSTAWRPHICAAPTAVCGLRALRVRGLVLQWQSPNRMVSTDCYLKLTTEHRSIRPETNESKQLY